LAGIAGGTLEAAKLTLTIEGVTAGLAFLEGRVIEGQNGIQVVSPRTALTGTLTVGGQVRGGSLAFVDAAGALFPDGWLGMANNIDAATKWLHIGGIRDGTVRRLALVADRTMISGSLGLGTPTPAGRLQISGPLPSIYLVGNTTANEDGLRVHYNETFGQRTGVIDVKGLSLRLRGESGAGGFGATERLFIDLTTGNVGIGTLNPSDRLDVEGHIRLNNWNLWLRGGADLNHGLGWFGLGKLFAGVNVDGPALFGASGGALGTTNGGQAMALQWNTAGDATIRGNVGTHGFSPAPRTPGWGGGIHTWDIEAEGTTWSRSGYQSGARDLAENCVSDEDLAPGDVVCVGATDAVRRSRTRDDVAVLGVVSTAPGVLLNATRDHCAAKVFPIALCGRVPCKVTDENGAIAVGDLLTTSSVAGHAMKAEPIVVEGERLFRPGTIIGKALDALASGRGVIDVFVLPA
jgi:hypothetical protein